MRDQPLVDMLTETFHHLETRLEEHRQAVAYPMAQQTMDYLHKQLQILQREFRALRGAAMILILAFGDSDGDDLWYRTVIDLQRTEPVQFRSPASAIASGNIELYELISYIGAAISLTRERRRVATAAIVRRLETATTEQPGSHHRVRIDPDLLERQPICDWLTLSEADDDKSHVALRTIITTL